MKTSHHWLKYLVLAIIVAVIKSAAPAQNKSLANLSVENLDGSRSKLSEYLKKGPIYLSFWALWCEPCKLELRALKPFAREHEDKPFTIIAVNQDSPKSLAKVKAYVKSQGYPFAVILDPNAQVFQAFNGQNLPFAVLMDKSGKVISTRTGFYPGDEKEIEKDILKLIAQEE